MLANKEDWNKLVMAAKMVSDPNIQGMVLVMVMVMVIMMKFPRVPW